MRRDFKAIQPRSQSLSPGFQISLLSRPAAEEGFRLHMAGKFTQNRNLAGREELFDNVFIRKMRMNAFHIDSNISFLSYGEKREAAGMRYVETKPLPPFLADE